MNAGLDALTERERETLRLILRGHDAKSTARQLGLSVHTINERLRDARRKLAVSSSREAARMLAEREGHHLLGDKELGEARATTVVAPDAPASDQMPNSRRLRWIIGGIAMSITLALLTVATLTDPAGAPVAQTAATAPAAESAPVQAARHWLELGDRSDWAGSYAATGTSFRSVNTLENWTKAATAVRAPLGRTISRTLVAEVDAPTPPSGNTVVKFRTDFANKAGAVETVALAREGGAWRVVGIYVE